MADGIWNQLTDGLLQDMRQHVRNLQDRVIEAGDVLHQSQSVNEKIVVMKEYKDEAGTVNSCFRGKDRAGLVRSLQHENRQILSLQEENRQMKLALEDIQRGMGLIMEKHRKAVRDFERSNVLIELMERRFDESQKSNIYEKRFYDLVDLVDGIFKEMGEQHAKDLEQYSTVCAENMYLRQALANKGAHVPGMTTLDSTTGLDVSQNSSKSVLNTSEETVKKNLLDLKKDESTPKENGICQDGLQKSTS